jgi:hypothetical protein
MLHRHLNTDQWTLAAIDSALERGDLPAWRELFAAARKDKMTARKILTIASAGDSTGGPLARELVLRLYPDLRAEPQAI